MLKPKRILQIACATSVVLLAALTSHAATGTVLFEDQFNETIPGWTAVEPPGANLYIDQPLRWQWDEVAQAWVENSNRYTDGSTNSATATAPMLINDATVTGAYTFKARMRTGDNDGFGLIFGYQNPTNFYRLTFGIEDNDNRRAGFPWVGWVIDRKVDGVSTVLHGFGTPDYVPFTATDDGLPFDVTISVSADQKLTLTILQDPEVGQIPYDLLTNADLPTAPDGKVGLMVWGMGGGAPPTGIQVTDMSLEPVELVNNPPAPMLSEWTHVVPSRADGTILGGHGAGIWGLALGTNGVYGALFETSDALGGNDASGQVDFVASTFVAGSGDWTDYLYTARVIPGDDDGHGIVLRYKDEMNFYRVALRAQSSTVGTRRGLSVQKVVDGFWEEVFFEEEPQFVPPSNVPYDISTLAVGNVLHITLVSDPEGVAQRYTYGPIEITGAAIPSGKVGLFSWAMHRTMYDFVRVIEMDGVPLQVTSEYGDPNPAAGSHGYTPGTSVTASVTSPFESAPGVRQVVTGWAGTGSVPASGTGSSVTVTMNEVSTLEWLWQTEYQVSATAAAGGEVTASGEWIAAGSPVSISAQAAEGYVFTGWNGDTASADSAFEVALARPLTVQAQFAVDSDSDSIPDNWEQLYFGNLEAASAGDADSDGTSNIEEYRRGTNPNHAEAADVADNIPDSPWVNVQRDPGLPGHLVVRDFGNGFKGIWENSNDYREADTNPFLLPEQRIANVSFEGPRIIISPEVWQESWNDFTGSAIFSVGDNDGNCVYFRYQDENNWYRVTFSGNDAYATWRAPIGVSIQKRVNGVFSELFQDPAGMYADPDDDGWYKRFRITVTATGSDFEVRVVGWTVLVDPPQWDEGFEFIYNFSDPDVPEGRFGVGTWGQSGAAPNTPANTQNPFNPVNAGALIEEVTITVAGEQVFHEDWADAPEGTELPEGWTTTGEGAAAGAWRVSAHNSIIQTGGYAPGTTGTDETPKGDADGTVLLAPAPEGPNYFLELGFHPFDNDGIGFVYNYHDPENYSRVMFVSEGTAPGRIPQGITVSRKSEGVWSDVVAGDPSFVYTPGSPFAVEFANNNGQYRMRVWNVDDESGGKTISWSGPAAAEGNRFGLTAWGQQDAHYTHARSFTLADIANPGGEVEITSITVEGETLTLSVERPEGSTYSVEQSSTLAPDSWTEVAENQTGDTWSTTVEQGQEQSFYRVRIDP